MPADSGCARRGEPPVPVLLVAVFVALLPTSSQVVHNLYLLTLFDTEKGLVLWIRCGASLRSQAWQRM
jgi:hypothetical protein